MSLPNRYPDDPYALGQTLPTETPAQPKQGFGLGEILGEVGAGMPAQANPYFSKGQTALVAGLRGYSMGRASRQRLAAADRLRQFEQKIGMPMDVFDRMPAEVKANVMQRAGFGDSSLDAPLSQFGGYTLNQLKNQGVPGGFSDTQTPGIGPTPSGEAVKFNLPTPAVPPLGLLRKEDILPVLNERFGSSDPEAAMREQRLASEKALEDQRRAATKNYELSAEEIRARTQNVRARTEEIVRQKDMDFVPDYILKSVPGVSFPEGRQVTYKEFDERMKHATGYNEFRQIVNEVIPEFIGMVQSGTIKTEGDVEKFLKESGIYDKILIPGQRFSYGKDEIPKGMIKAELTSILKSQQMKPPTPPELPQPEPTTTIPGYPGYSGGG
jgi:hypothetical protein